MFLGWIALSIVRNQEQTVNMKKGGKNEFLVALSGHFLSISDDPQTSCDTKARPTGLGCFWVSSRFTVSYMFMAGC